MSGHVNNPDPDLGERQLEIMVRVQKSPSGQIIIDPQTQNQQWCAVKRLVKRGFLRRDVFQGGTRFGRLTVYTLTELGRQKIEKERRKGHLPQ